MNTESYNTIVEKLRFFADNHLAIQRFDTSFFEELPVFSTGDNNFPIMYATPSDVEFDALVDNFTFRIYCVDLLLEDRSNETEVLNQTLLILRDLFNWIKIEDNLGIDTSGTSTATPVNNFLMDYTTGWYLDITIEYSPETNTCSIPFE